MIPSLPLVLALHAAAAMASPLVPRAEGTAASMFPENVMVMNKNGTMETIKHSDWLSSLEAAGVLLEKPAINEAFLKAIDLPADIFKSNETLSKRQSKCGSTLAVVTDSTERFVDWDVQMSPVVCAVGDMTINVLKGYMVANAVSVNGNVNPTLVADKLTASLGISFTRTWTTQSSITTVGTVKDGFCGAMITRPLVTRRYGRTMRGCPGSYTEIGTWMADDHGEGSYAGIEWISGAVSMCAKQQSIPPLTRCEGEGEFI